MHDQNNAPWRARALARISRVALARISRVALARISSVALARIPSIALVGAYMFAPALALACACGCGIFDVGGASGIMPGTEEGDYSLYFRYDYMNQGTNWEGDHKAPRSDNQDKNLNTSFYFTGAQWHVNPDWTLMTELPVYARHLTTTDDGTVQGPAGSIYTGKMVSLGDLEVMADYTGLFADKNTGLIFGVKFPTGDFSGPKGPLGGYEFDRDSLPGTGSTDLILGIYHDGALTEDGSVGYYVQARGNIPVLTQGGYRPGNEFDTAAGIDYSFQQVGPFKSISPVLSILTSYRQRDTGPAADFFNSGYYRVLAAPGVQFHFANLRLYTDVELPLYQHVNAAGNLAINGSSGQMVASALYKIQLNYDF
jgi:hypothetical protein